MTQNKTGLVSVTFRQLDPEEIVTRVAECGLDGIEWGGDVHAPHGDLAACERAGTLTREAGLEVMCYGSYYCVVAASPTGPTFEETLRSAQVMGAPLILVWPGGVSPDRARPEDLQRVIDDSVRVADLAGEAGVRLAAASWASEKHKPGRASRPAECQACLCHGAGDRCHGLLLADDVPAEPLRKLAFPLLRLVGVDVDGSNLHDDALDVV